ncbi:hypothetical protein BDN70DRAFT_180086 [Pholiota conissans]|uniref:Uncharacterized protein n=1 Tax=Pholiota conissans TaxID=109636 RepID=A0A9P5ZCF2_9AGAR|nr:hypothetical protein BDN70DRAFT_180086 [Pholiota conissans]
MAGIPGKASQIILDLVNPGSARIGKVLPTGNPIGTVSLTNGRSVKTFLVDATNPAIFVDHAELQTFLPIDDYIKGKASVVKGVSPILEEIHQQGVRWIELDPSAQALLKLMMLHGPHSAEDASQKLASAYMFYCCKKPYLQL